MPRLMTYDLHRSYTKRENQRDRQRERERERERCLQREREKRETEREQRERDKEKREGETERERKKKREGETERETERDRERDRERERQKREREGRGACLSLVQSIHLSASVSPAKDCPLSVPGKGRTRMSDQHQEDQKIPMDEAGDATSARGAAEDAEMETTSHTAFRLSLTGFSISPAGETSAPEDMSGEARAEETEEDKAERLASAIARAEPLPDTLLFVARFLGERVSSAPATKGADGTYDFKPLKHVFIRKEPNAFVQNALLRGELPVEVCAYTAATGKEEQRVTPLATTNVDLAPLLAGAARVGGNALNFESMVTLEEQADGGAVEMPGDTRIGVALESGVMTFTTRRRPAGEGDVHAPEVDADADEAVPTEGEFSVGALVTEAEAHEGIVVTARVTKISPVPNAAIVKLKQDADVAAEGESVSIDMNVALHLPCVSAHETDKGFTAVCSSFTIDGTVDEVTIPMDDATNEARIVIPASFKDVIVQKLLSKQPALIEMVASPGNDGIPLPALHAVASLDLSPLLEPGSSSLVATVAFDAPNAPGAPSMVPLHAAAKGAEADATSSSASETAAECVWAAAGSSFSVDIRLSRPIVPPWEAPDAPAMTVEKLIPARQVEAEPLDGRGLAAFAARIEEVGKQMGEVYTSAFLHDAGADRQMTESEKVNRRRSLIYELNKTGAYLRMKESLKSSVVSVVQEKFRLSGGMSRDEMSAVYNELYVLLSENAHSVLNGMTGALPTRGVTEPPAQPSAEELLKLKSLADELEIQGDVASANAHHQSRLVATTNAEVWYDYGAFCMRTGERGKAEECFRESLQCFAATAAGAAAGGRTLDTNVGSLLLLASLLIGDGIFEQAEVYAYKAMELEKSPRTWSLLALIYEDLGKRKEMDNSVYMAKKIAKEAGGDADEATASLALALLLLDCHCPELAARALELGASFGLSSGCEGGTDALLCQARCDELGGRVEEAGASLRQASEASPGNAKVLVMLGKHYAARGEKAEAIAALEAASKAADGLIPLDASLLLGSLHARSGNHAVARVRYLDACRTMPCCSTWLGAGIASYRLGLLHDAEMCLAEANVLDNHRPSVWAHLALVSVAAGRWAEAAEALRLAIQNGVRDAAVLEELGDAYKAHGQIIEAVRMYKLATGCGAEPTIYLKLAEALASTRDFTRARNETMSALDLMGRSDGFSPEEGVAVRAAELLATCDRELGIAS